MGFKFSVTGTSLETKSGTTLEASTFTSKTLVKSVRFRQGYGFVLGFALGGVWRKAQNYC